MKLTIVYPCVGRAPGQKYVKGWQMEPLSSGHLAGLTPKDVEIRFFDDRLEDIDFDVPTDLAALTVETYTALRAYQIASEFRSRGVPVVMGGFHPTLVPEEALEYAEAIVIGEAEAVWPKLLRDFQSGSLKRIYTSESRADISESMPDRSIYRSRRYLPITLVERGRGCLSSCEFCVVQKFFNSTYTTRNSEVVIDELKRIRRKNRLVFFVDDNVVARPDSTKAFLEALIPLKLKWVSQGSLSMVRDKELLKLLQASGCVGVLVGFESLEKKVLLNMNKGFNAAVGDPAEAVREFHKHGLRLYATFVFGYDEDIPQSFDRVVEFCIQNKVFVAAFNHLVPFPGTPLYERLRAEGRLFSEKWWLDPKGRFGEVVFKSAIPPRELEEQCLRARNRFYSLHSILRRFFHPTNFRDGSMIPMYLLANFLLRREAHERLCIPFGDTAFGSPLIKVQSTEESIALPGQEASISQGAVL